MNKVLPILLMLAIPSNAAFDLNGSSDYVEACDSCGVTGSNARTYMAWVNVDAFGTGTERTIMRQGNVGGNGTQWSILAEDNAISIAFGSHRIITPKSALQTGVWYHVATVFPDGQTSTSAALIYIDGINQTLSTEGGVPQTLNTASLVVVFGFNPAASTGFYDGKIDDMRVYSKELSAKEIERIATSRSRIPTTDGLRGWWPLDSGIEGVVFSSGTQILDRSPLKSLAVVRSSMTTAKSWLRYP